MMLLGVFAVHATPVLARDFQVMTDLRVDGNVNTPYGGIGRYENLLKYSEELTQTGSWTRTGLDATTPVALDATGPTGVATSAVTMKNGAAANGTLAQIVTTTVTLPYTLSGWAKAGTSTTAQLELTTNGTGATTDTQALTLTASWQRFSVAKSAGAGTSPTTVTATLKNTGAAATTILLWGVQLEQASSPGVYAKTTGSAMTAGRGLVATSGGLLFPDGSSQTTAVSTSSGFSVDAGGTLANGLVSYWKLDEASGSLVGDAARFNDGSAINGPTIVAGKLGSARSFDGTDDYVSTANESNFDFAGPLTISAWVKVTTDTTTYRMIVIKGTSGAHPIPLQLRVNPSEQVEFQQSQGGASVTDITGAAATAALTLNQWYHVVATNDGTTARVYLNGTQAASDATPATSPTLDDEPVWLGAAVDGYYFTGLIDEVGIWSKALSAAEITDLYNAGAANAYRTSTAIGGWTDDGTVVRLSTGSDAVGIGTTSPAATALLDLTSTTKGLLAPRMTTTQRDAITSPAAGLLLYNTTTNAYNVYNGTSWGAVGSGGGSGDVLTTGTNTFTATTASPIKIKPSAAPTADTKLLDMQATGAGTTNFSVDAEGDVTANSLDLTTPLPDAEVADTITASNYLPLAGGTLTGNLVIPNAGTIGQAAGPLLTFDDAANELEISGGNVGIGTASPANLLHLSGTATVNGDGRRLLRLDDATSFASGVGPGIALIGKYSSAGDPTEFANIKGIKENATGGDWGGALVLSTFTNGASTIAERVRITSTGNVGIGTASPAQKLHVEGQCVTGDTLLPILKKAEGRRQKAEDEWVVETVAIKDVRAGMLVYSLNEATGKLEPHRINGLLDMGVQPVFRLTTESGRTIRTTGNHPYLVRVVQQNQTRDGWRSAPGVYGEEGEVNQDQPERDEVEQRFAHGPLALRLQEPEEDDQRQDTRRDVERQQSHRLLNAVFANVAAIVRNSTVTISPTVQISHGILPAALGTNTPTTSEPKMIFAPSRKKSATTSRPLLGSMATAPTMTYRAAAVKWTKVVGLRPGDEIAVATDDLGSVAFVKIARITSLPPEPVYDIEVDGTHNFVANGIIAHNTYLKGATADTTAPALNVVNSAAGSLLYARNDGNVGIGTASPAQKLSVAGTVESTSGGFKFPDGSAQTTAVQTTSAFLPDTGGSLTTGLVSYWKVDEGGGASVRDAVSVNDGTMTNGPTWTTSGKIGKALSFDGTNDYVEVADSGSLNPSSITVAAWIKTSDTTSNDQICSKDAEAGGRVWQFTKDANKIAFIVFNASTSGAADSAASVAVGDNAWHHAVGTWDGTTIRVYVDGVERGSTAFAGSLRTGQTNLVLMGRSQNADPGYFTGLIDELGIWSKALSTAEITDLYNAGTGNAYRTSTAIGGWTDDGTVVRLSTGSDAVGIGTTSPAATALLDLTSTTKGLLAPRLTTTQRDAITSPAAGLLLYNTTTNAYNVYNGTSWGAVGGGSGDVLTTGTNTFTATTASPILIKPSSAPTANTKLFDLQATGAGTTTFSVDTEGDVLANSLTLTTPLAIAQGGTGTTTGSLTGTGALTFTAGGTNQNVTLTPSGTGATILNGNVGLGTTAPGTVGTTTGLSTVLNVAPSSGYSRLAMQGDATWFVQYDTAGTANDRASLIRTDGGILEFSSLNDDLTLKTANILNLDLSSGNVGIGTASPSAALQVPASVIFSSSSGGVQIGGTALAAGEKIHVSTSGSASSLVMLDASGNVGIGTASPGAKLEVAGGGVAIPSGQKINLESSAGDTYLMRNADNTVSFFLDGIEVARLEK